MQCDNVFQLFSPVHLAWLYRCQSEGLEVTVTDLDSIEAAVPGAADDPLFAEFRALGKAGKLRRRSGRKPASIGTLARLWFAKREIEDEVRAILDRRRSGAERRSYNGIPPRVQAADYVAHEFYFHCTGRALLNRISKERIL